MKFISGSNGNDLTTWCVREFIGEFVLMLTVGLNVLTNSSAGAWSTAALLTCMIYAPGTCSRARCDPAASFCGDGFRPDHEMRARVPRRLRPRVYRA